MELVIRATAVYWFLWLVVRGIGKRSLAELSPMDLLVVVVLGDIVQQGITQEDMSLTGAFLVVSVFALWMLASDWAARRWRPVEHLLEGTPVYVIEDGRPHLDVIHRERMTIEHVHAAAREKGYPDLTRIAFGVLEPDGKFSFVSKDALRDPA